MVDQGGLRLNSVQTLKLLILFLGVIAITVGYWGHYTFSPRELMNNLKWQVNCKQDEKCSLGLMTLEETFIVIVTTFLVLSGFSFILGEIFDFSKGTPKVVDALFHFLGGLLVIIGGILMISSSVLIDNYVGGTLIEKEYKDLYELCDSKFYRKKNRIVFTCKCFHVEKGRITDPSDPQPPSLVPKALERILRDFNCFAQISEKLDAEDPQSDTIYNARFTEFRNKFNFHYKNSAGVLAFLNGIVYFAVGILSLIGTGQSGPPIQGQGQFVRGPWVGTFPPGYTGMPSSQPSFAPDSVSSQSQANPYAVRPPPRISPFY